MKSNAQSITTTLPQDTLKELESISKTMKLPKNKILVMAFNEWNRARERKIMRKKYTEMANDTESLMLAESGITDYKKNINALEK